MYVWLHMCGRGGREGGEGSEAQWGKLWYIIRNKMIIIILLTLLVHRTSYYYRSFLIIISIRKYSQETIILYELFRLLLIWLISINTLIFRRNTVVLRCIVLCCVCFVEWSCVVLLCYVCDGLSCIVLD